MVTREALKNTRNVTFTARLELGYGAKNKPAEKREPKAEKEKVNPSIFFFSNSFQLRYITLYLGAAFIYFIGETTWVKYEWSVLL